MGTSHPEASERDGELATATTASPVDYAAYGHYAPPAAAFVESGGSREIVYPIDDRITDDGSSRYLAEAGRYHLYVALSCPVAQRPLIAMKLRGLENVVTWSAVDPVRDGRGWAFRSGRGHGPDPVNGFKLLGEAYLATDPGFDGHISVPALWDRATGRLVSNHYSTLAADLETQFGTWASPEIDLYPRQARAEIDALNEKIHRHFFQPAARAASASPQDHERLAAEIFTTLAWFEERLSGQRFLLGDRLTDADILLFTALVRFDILFVPLGRLARAQLVDYPQLWGYARDLYQRPAFGQTTNFDHLRADARQQFPRDRTSPADWAAPHQRHRLTKGKTP